MDVIVDGERNFRFSGEPEDALAAVAVVAEWLRERGRGMLSVNVDGESVWPDALVDRLRGRSLTAVGRLEVRSALLSELIQDSLRELREALPDLPEACRHLARVFQSDTPAEAFDPFQELADIWSHIKARELMVAEALHIDLNSEAVNGKSLASLHEDLNAQLEEAVRALEVGDCVLLGDLLEYELAPRAEREAAIALLLEERARNAAL